MARQHDDAGPGCILGLGCVAVDELLYVADLPRDGKAAVLRRERRCGGTTATALMAAARLGAPSAYAGVLGNDKASNFAAKCLARHGVNLKWLKSEPSARPIRCTIVVKESDGSRSVFYDLNEAVGAMQGWPPKEALQSAGVLLVDTLGMPGMVEAAQTARHAGIPIVADLESDETPLFGELLSLVDHLIVSEAFALRITSAVDAAAACRRLWHSGRQAVVVTCGAAGCWFIGPEAGEQGQSLHLPALPVKAIDTTGCGDVFHGAYAAALLRPLPLIDRLKMATAAAGYAASRTAGQVRLATWEEVSRLLSDWQR
ncbi:MAG: PfkB family carbohydrate kinase [Pirellulales bacterium]